MTELSRAEPALVSLQTSEAAANEEANALAEGIEVEVVAPLLLVAQQPYVASRRRTRGSPAAPTAEVSRAEAGGRSRRGTRKVIGVRFNWSWSSSEPLRRT